MRHRFVHFENSCVCVDTMGCGCSIELLHKLEIIARENWIQEPIYGSAFA